MKDRKGRRSTSPTLIGETREVSILKGIHEELQKIAFYGTQHPGKPKVIKLPRPKTAKDIAAQRDAYQRHLEIEAAITYVPREEFDRIIKEHGG